MKVRSGETRRATPASRLRIVRTAAGGAAAMLLCSAVLAQAGGGATLQEIAARFPEANRVMADYGDDPSRFAALTDLLNVLPNGRATYNKSFEYSQTITQITAKYGARGVDPQVRNNFDDRASQLMRDQNFKRSVLERYNVANLPVVNQPATGQRLPPSPPARRPAAGLDLEQLLGIAAPFWIVTLIAMAFVPRLVMRLTGRLASSDAPENLASSNPLQLPESLRKFKVLGEEYALEMQSGQVIEEKTWSETYNSVINSAPVIQFVGNQAYQTGGGVSIVSTTVTKDRVWVRTLNGAETVWNFTDAGFQTRKGQLVSAVARPRGNNNSDFILVHNHHTGQSQGFITVQTSKKIGIFFPWIVTTLVGTAGFLVGVAAMFQAILSRGGHSLLIAPAALAAATFTDWGTCLICGAIAGRIFAGFARGRVQRQRVKRYDQRYKPALIRHLQQATPALVQHFGRA